MEKLEQNLMRIDVKSGKNNLEDDDILNARENDLVN